ncbi:MAG: DUF5683 domain-containing protein [Chitinophagaceae bacterium]
MKHIRFFCLLLIGSLVCFFAAAQKKDSTGLRVTEVQSVGVKKVMLDSTGKKKHDPHKATMHSLILPGWGQAYNRSYWKIPIVYAALGITAYIFNDNRIWYNKTKYAYFYTINRGTADSSKFQLSNITDPALRSFAINGDSYSLQLYRNEFRKNIDYSVLFFMFFWALNVVDATVDGHLKDFDVSSDLSMRIKPSFTPMPNAIGFSSIGLSVVFDIGKHPVKHNEFQMP